MLSMRGRRCGARQPGPGERRRGRDGGAGRGALLDAAQEGERGGGGGGEGGRRHLDRHSAGARALQTESLTGDAAIFDSAFRVPRTDKDGRRVHVADPLRAAGPGDVVL